MNLEQLKCRAYDLMALIQNAELQLREVNQAIAKEMEKPLEQPVNEDAKPMDEVEETKA